MALEGKKMFLQIYQQQKVRKNVGLTLNGAGELVTKDMEKVKIFNAFLGSVFTGKTHP